jgi:DNA-binding response OmpR family regulator
MNILLIEDDPGIGRFVSRGLSAEGNKARWVRTGQQGADALEEGAFDIVILDVGLPDIDGTLLCKRFRQARMETPVLMLTARDSLDDKLEGFASGADDYLTKPFAFEELLARLNALARRPASAEQLAFDTLRLESLTHSIRIGEVKLPLPKREFGVLSCLVRAQGAAVRRADILDQVWGSEVGVNDNTVDVYVGYLRRRLAPFGDAVRIDAVRGVGFRIAGKAKP